MAGRGQATKWELLLRLGRRVNTRVVEVVELEKFSKEYPGTHAAKQADEQRERLAKG